MARRTYRDEWRPWTGRNAITNVRAYKNRMTDPFRWYEPRRVFVCSMGDLFHGHLPYGFTQEVFGIMGAAWWHTFQVLTKRPERMAERLVAEEHAINQRVLHWSGVLLDGAFRAKTHARLGLPPWPLPNVWVGTSVEDQERADERIPHLLQTPAVLRFVSVEPLLGPVDIYKHIYVEDSIGAYNFDATEELRTLHWVICGGESGPGAREMDHEWICGLRDQCARAGVPFFVKQLGTSWARRAPGRDYKGAKPEEWPEDLRVREFPEAGR